MKKLLLLIIALMFAACSLTKTSNDTPSSNTDYKFQKHTYFNYPRQINYEFGLQVFGHNLEPKDVAVIRELKPYVMRLDLSWVVTEPQKGVYYTNTIDAFVNLSQEYNGKILLIVDYNNPLYASPNNPAGYPFMSQEANVAMNNLLTFLANRYKDKMIFELWNEPSLNDNNSFWPPSGATAQAYNQWSYGAYQAIKAGNSNTLVVGPAAAGFKESWQKDLYKQGFLNYVNGITVHPYRDSIPESVAPDYASLAGVMQSYQPTGVSLPIIAGEWGYGSMTRETISETNCALYLVRMNLFNMYQNIPFTVYFHLRETNSDRWRGSILRGFDAEYNAAYFAARTMVNELRDYSLVDNLALSKAALHTEPASSDYFALLFKKGSKSKIVVWSKEKNISFGLVSNGSITIKKVVETFGNTIPMEFVATPYPKYIEIE